tara:strand:- start:404 stop:613 length:210 start_codon:yes stop_codon:yes gene_type:complete
MKNRLDLHGVRHTEVDRIVENFILLNEPPMRIITGNSDKMIELVIEVLDRNDVVYERFRPGQVTILRWS